METRPLIIGSGFYATRENHAEKLEFLDTWTRNTQLVNASVVIVDNSHRGLGWHPTARVIRVTHNLGHACTPFPEVRETPLLGWSMSWIISAMVAYSEKCDFVYKEQDCLAFGNWLPIVRRNLASIGRHNQMPCEQSLFYVRHDFILQFVNNYLLQLGHDCQTVTEQKFRNLLEIMPNAIDWHELPGGRNRPLPDLSKPFYLQKITNEEMETLKNANLI